MTVVNEDRGLLPLSKIAALLMGDVGKHQFRSELKRVVNEFNDADDAERHVGRTYVLCANDDKISLVLGDSDPNDLVISLTEDADSTTWYIDIDIIVEYESKNWLSRTTYCYDFGDGLVSLPDASDKLIEIIVELAN